MLFRGIATLLASFGKSIAEKMIMHKATGKRYRAYQPPAGYSDLQSFFDRAYAFSKRV
jgi:hypothetical protein